ncbi:hypothetical protein JW933_08465, partial [candidate division FCPU426 bacterium]|nr:hypothetical protein [candidate division FCPU426 bacterium]
MDIFDEISTVNSQGIKTFKIPLAGKWQKVNDIKTIVVRNPATNEVLGAVPDCGGQEVESALAAARAGSP